VIFIGWDGVRSDALQLANTPNLDSLIGHSIHSFHVDRGPHTVSTPGWSTILHGVWPEKHGLTENSFRKNRYETYPDIFIYCVVLNQH
jgi:predicted AlkP superfamily pyrophosphatase or phosphodiesterase